MVRARKRLGQHFLHHRAILERIAAALEVPGAPGPAAGVPVLEIGPGQGSLTAVLAQSGARVVAIEKDRELAALVRVRLPQVRVIEGDALALDWRATAGVAPDAPLLVAGNIPYNITSPLLAKALTPPLPTRVVFLMQEEVADRLAASPGIAEYGALSVGVQSVARVERLFKVPAAAFHPKPQVDSAVVRLTPLERPVVNSDLVPALRRLVVGLFGYRRKQLGRGLRELTGWPPERIATLLQGLGLSGTGRPETLSPEAFAQLLRGLIDAGWAPR